MDTFYFNKMISSIETVLWTCITITYLFFIAYIFFTFIRNIEKNKYPPPHENFIKKNKRIIQINPVKYHYPLFGDSVNYNDLHEIIEENKDL